MTEIEIRGRISKNDFERLFEIMSKDGELADHYHRLSIDLSPGFDEATKIWKNSSGTDIRLKKSDSKEKLSIKTGGFQDLERKEVEVKIQEGQFLNALDLLDLLGHKTGMVYFWESWEYNYLGCEIKLSKYTDEYYTFEIEGKENSNVEEMATKLNLISYTKEEYRAAIDWENQNIHKLYSRDLVEEILKKEF